MNLPRTLWWWLEYGPCSEKVQEASHGPPFRPQRLKFIHLFGQPDVEFGDAAGAVRRQPDVDPVIDIRPVRMVIHLLRDQRHPRHEAESGAEGFEPEALLQRLAALALLPAFEQGQRRQPLFRGKELNHVQTATPRSS